MTMPAGSPFSQPPAGWPTGPGSEQPRGTDGFAVAALVLGILPVLAGLLGVVFGVVALRRIRTSGAAGRGMAVAGTILGALWLTLSTVAVVLALSSGPDRTDGRSGVVTSGDVLLDDLTVGDCITSIDEDVVRTLPAVPCDQPHTVQVYGVFDLDLPTDATFPGDEQVQRLADGGCDRRAAESGINPDLELYDYFPSAESWDLPDRKVICLFETDTTERDLLADALASRSAPSATS